MPKPLAPEYQHAVVKNALDACVTETPYGTPVAYAFNRTVLTPRGEAAVSISRLKRQLLTLDAADRAVARDMLAGLVAELDAAAWADFGNALP